MQKLLYFTMQYKLTFTIAGTSKEKYESSKMKYLSKVPKNSVWVWNLEKPYWHFCEESFFGSWGFLVD